MNDKQIDEEWYSSTHYPEGESRGILYWSGPGLYFSRGSWGDQRASDYWMQPSLATRYESIEEATGAGWTVKVYKATE